MITRDTYVALLEKRATEEERYDGDESINKDYDRNLEDSRTYLHTIFTRADAVQSDQSETAKKLFPGTEGTKQSGNPLMKVARAQFFASMEELPYFKHASPIHRELVLNAFHDELQKIAEAR